MHITDFQEIYLKELQEARSVEAQLVEALPRMKAAASAADLKDALEAHLGETRAQLDRIHDILDRHKVDAREHEDQAMRAILSEAEKWIGMLDNPALRDAGLIASAQRIEHYEVAVYGTLATWAKQLGHDEDLSALLETLEQEKSADSKLSELAKREVNPEAA